MLLDVSIGGRIYVLLVLVFRCVLFYLRRLLWQSVRMSWRLVALPYGVYLVSMILFMMILMLSFLSSVKVK